MLGKVTVGSSLCKNDITGVGGKFSYDNLEQCGLSGTVNADNGRFFVVINVKRNPTQDFLFAKTFGYVVTCKYHSIFLFFGFWLGIVRVNGKTDLVDTVFIHGQYLVGASALGDSFAFGWKMVKQVDDVTGDGIVVFGF